MGADYKKQILCAIYNAIINKRVQPQVAEMTSVDKKAGWLLAELRCCR
jgi:hypothetical protein